ncbi:radical SAM protein [Candidatus Omnitrophota bacterium]
MEKSQKSYKYVYGPVSSWRLGRSLGIDPISRKEKICTFDCIYCQLGGTIVFSDKREIFIPTNDLIKEITSLPPLEIDYVTFSGKGEPTLAENLGEMVSEIRKIKKVRTAVITNSSLIDRKDVREDLALFDLVMLKLDACSEALFNEINRPMEGITFNRVLKGIAEFKSVYKGKLAVQVMFIEKNKICAPGLAQIVKEIAPFEIQINTPLRPSDARPLSKRDLDDIKRFFDLDNINVVSVYEAKKKEAKPLNKDDTLKRRDKLNRP